MGKTLILKSLLRSLNSISFMLIIFTFKLIQTIRILWFCHRSHPTFPKLQGALFGGFSVKHCLICHHFIMCDGASITCQVESKGAMTLIRSLALDSCSMPVNFDTISIPRCPGLCSTLINLLCLNL
jgi:hypothetical protein